MGKVFMWLVVVLCLASAASAEPQQAVRLYWVPKGDQVGNAWVKVRIMDDGTATFSRGSLVQTHSSTYPTSNRTEASTTVKLTGPRLAELERAIAQEHLPNRYHTPDGESRRDVPWLFLEVSTDDVQASIDLRGASSMDTTAGQASMRIAQILLHLTSDPAYSAP